MSYGIALSGGGTRGAAHAGVLLALEENGLAPTSIAGTSAGSIIAGLYATGMHPAEIAHTVRQLSKTGYLLVDPDFKGIFKAVTDLALRRTVTLSGIIKGDRLERWFEQMTNGKHIQQSDMPIVIPAVDLGSGNTIVYSNQAPRGELSEHIRWESDITIARAIRASIAVPTVFRPQINNGLYLVDGGVTDNLPVGLLVAAGEPNVLAVDISEQYQSPEHYNIVDIATHSLSIMSRRLKNCTADGERLLLHLTLPESAGLLTFGQMDECVQIGYDATIEMLPTIKAMLQ